MRAAALAVGVVLLGLGGFLGISATSVERGRVSVGRVPKAAASCVAKDCLPSFRGVDLTGRSVTSESLRGKVVLVNFWATWCPPCVKEIPALQAVHARHAKDGFVIVGVHVDQSPDSQVKAFLEARGVSYPSIRTTPAIERSFGSPRTLPTSFLYDRQGNLRAQWNSAIPENALEDEVAGLLGDGL